MELYDYLLPAPQEVRALEVEDLGIQTFGGMKIDHTLAKQEYILKIKSTKVDITAGSKTGEFYAKQTLNQLIKLYRDNDLNGSQKIPPLFIHDLPDIETRGYYYDVTRGKVPKLKTLKLLADRLAHYKVNQLQLYVEHTFAFEGFEEMWQDASPLTAKEITELDNYCRKKHIELVPSLSTFGHLYHLLRTEKYKHLCELPNTENVPFNWPDRMLHHTIDVSNPESIEVIKNMLDQYIPLFKSDKFNICGDETFDLGRGRNEELAQKVGKGRLYVDFLKKIISHVQSHDKKVQFWGDILLEHPEYIDEIPKDALVLNWDYAPEPDEERVRKISESGLKQYLCPGVWGWNSFVNDIQMGYDNISKMAKYSQKYKVEGFLNTDWGDFGNVNSLSTSIPGMIMGAAFSWNAVKIPDYQQTCKIISRLEYGDLSGELVEKMAEFCRYEGELYNVWVNLAHYDYQRIIGEKHMWHNGQLFEKSAEEMANEAKRVSKNIDGFLTLMENAKRINPDDVSEIEVAVRGYALMWKLLAKNIEGETLNKKTPDRELQLEKQVWIKNFSRVWRVRNKKSELNRIIDLIKRL